MCTRTNSHEILQEGIGNNSLDKASCQDWWTEDASKTRRATPGSESNSKRGRSHVAGRAFVQRGLPAIGTAKEDLRRRARDEVRTTGTKGYGVELVWVG